MAERVALFSLAAAGLLVASKLAAGLASGSLALLSEAAHSTLDAGASGLAYVSIRIASRPPDRDHPYGHGRAENVFALLQGAAMFALSMFLVREGLARLREGSEVEATWYTFFVIAFSMFVDSNRAWILTRAARRYRSAALRADAYHFTADLVTSLGVLAGLVLVRLGSEAADAYAALGVAAFVAFLSVRIGWRSIDVLMDRSPPEVSDRIRRTAEEVDGVAEVRRVRLRYAGEQPQVDVVIAISRTLGLELAHNVTEEVERAIRAVEPGADVVVHVEPVADEEAVAEQVTSIAARDLNVSQVHNVYVTQRSDGLHITLHAKFPEGMELKEAHEIADRLEREIAKEIAGVSRVDTHIEPLEPDAPLGTEVTRRHGALVESVSRIAGGHPEVEDCHEVVVTETDEGLSLVIHCTAAGGRPVASVHKVATTIEDEIHARWPEVARVTVHFEPPEEPR